MCNMSPWEEDPLPAELLEVDGEGPHAALGGVRVVLLRAHSVCRPLRPAPPSSVPE